MKSSEVAFDDVRAVQCSEIIVIVTIYYVVGRPLSLMNATWWTGLVDRGKSRPWLSRKTATPLTQLLYYSLNNGW